MRDGLLTIFDEYLNNIIGDDGSFETENGLLPLLEEKVRDMQEAYRGLFHALVYLRPSHQCSVYFSIKD
ncbi:MAG: hypothetical protein IJT66_04690 [Clostridia bacterium]|nr:hypothetical protein [Clostridia bacterium]